MTAPHIAPTEADAAANGSVVRRILLGSQLRRLREGMGVTRERAGYAIRASESKISRMELGRVGFKARDVEDLLTLYGIVAADERALLLDLARDANQTGWWHSYSDVLPAWFQTYVGLEAAASHVGTYEVQFVHGLLQTEDYTRGVMAGGHRPGLPAEEVERRVAVRAERQKLLLTGGGRTSLLCVLDEAVLHRPFGGPRVMAAQLAHLAEVSEERCVELRVVPFAQGAHAAESGAFTRLRFPESDLADVVYVEQLTGALYLDKADEVARYDAVLERLEQLALSPSATRDLLRAAGRRAGLER